MKKLLKIGVHTLLALMTAGVSLFVWGIYRIHKLTKLKEADSKSVRDDDFGNPSVAVLLGIVVFVGSLIIGWVSGGDEEKPSASVERQEKVESQVKKEEQEKKETKKPKKPSVEQHAKNVVLGVMGEENEDGDKTVQDVIYNEHNGHVTVKVDYGTIFMANSAQKHKIIKHQKDILDGIFNRKEVKSAAVLYYVTGEDRYGNSTDIKYSWVQIDRDLEDKINWEGISPENFADVTEMGFHPEIALK